MNSQILAWIWTGHGDNLLRQWDIHLMKKISMATCCHQPTWMKVILDLHSVLPHHTTCKNLMSHTKFRLHRSQIPIGNNIQPKLPLGKKLLWTSKTCSDPNKQILYLETKVYKPSEPRLLKHICILFCKTEGAQLMLHNKLLRLVVLQLNLEDVQFKGGHGCMLSQGSCQYHTKAAMKRFIRCFQIQRLQ